MSRDPLTQLQIADLSLKIPVEVTYALDNEGEVKVISVSVVHGPLSLDITSQLTEDDLFDIIEQLENWYISTPPGAAGTPNSGEQP